MRQIMALAGREWRSYFLSPVGYIIMALFLLMAGWIFWTDTFQQGQLASMRAVFSGGTLMLIFIGPAISMKTISEERRMGTFEMLMTSPVTEAQVILGKFLGTMGLLAMMLLPLAIHAMALEKYGNPDYGEVACGVLGMMLAGAVYLSSGILASTLTASQVLAFLMTLFFWFGLSFGAKKIPESLSEPWSTIAFAVDPDPRLRDFAIGLIDTSNVVYFVSLTAMFLLFAVCSLAVRRWR